MWLTGFFSGVIARTVEPAIMISWLIVSTSRLDALLRRTRIRVSCFWGRVSGCVISSGERMVTYGVEGSWFAGIDPRDDVRVVVSSEGDLVGGVL